MPKKMVSMFFTLLFTCLAFLGLGEFELSAYMPMAWCLMHKGNFAFFIYTPSATLGSGMPRRQWIRLKHNLDEKLAVILTSSSAIFEDQPHGRARKETGR
jgi:hypothetical protein